MADFTSAFWSWLIFVLVAAGIIALFILNIWMTEPRRRPQEKPKTMGHVWDQDLKELNNPLPRWWLNLYYITLVFGIGYLVLYPGLGNFAGTLGWTQLNQYQDEVEAADQRFGPLYEKYFREQISVLAGNQQALKTGQRLFLNYCATCHGSDARGGSGFPNLRDDDWLYGGEPQQIKTSIMNGRTGVMPGWGSALGSEGVFNVTEYVLSLNGRRVDEKVAREGEQKFKQLCIACHGSDAKGNPAMGAPNLTNNKWLYGGSQRVVMKTIAEGRQGQMPAHADFLGEAKVHLLAAYVYSLSHQKEAQ
jgi:cytochrome c oxidase cbb3-type subunit 3